MVPGRGDGLLSRIQIDEIPPDRTACQPLESLRGAPADRDDNQSPQLRLERTDRLICGERPKLFKRLIGNGAYAMAPLRKLAQQLEPLHIFGRV